MSQSKQKTKSTSGSTSTARQRRLSATIIQIRESFGVNLVTVALVVAAIWALTALIGLRINALGVLVLFVAGTGVSLISNRTGGFSFSFALISAGIVGFLVEHTVPEAIVMLFDPVAALLARVPGFAALASLSSLQFLALAIGVVLVVWTIDIRAASALYRRSGRPEAANADTVARALGRRVEKLAGVYIAIVVAAGSLAIALVAQALQGGGDLLGELFGWLAQDPVSVAAVVNWFVGWLAVGGEVGGLRGVPILGDVLGALAGLGPTEFGLIAGAIIVIAWGSREVSS